MSIDPARPRPNERTPPGYIEAVSMDGHELPLDTERRFAPGTGRFRFDYAALTFTGPEQVSYLVMLEGLDSDRVVQVLPGARVPQDEVECQRMSSDLEAAIADGLIALAGE